MSKSENVAHEAAWLKLENHAQSLSSQRVESMFESDSQRAQRFSMQACGLFVDFSKQRLDPASLASLMALVECSDLASRRAQMFAGEVANSTENRAALHLALRWPADDPQSAPFSAQILRDVEAVREQMSQFAEAVRDGSWTGFDGQSVTDIVNIGIGGSDLGPALVCDALREFGHPRLRCHFVSNADSSDLATVLVQCDPARTLFIVASKSFATQETLLNARSARDWLLRHVDGDAAAVARHFVAVSSAVERCVEFGIGRDNIFGFWDWVGGRFSLWSSVGLVAAVFLGMDRFRELHAGAHAMDVHFHDAPIRENLPVLLAMIGIWNRDLLSAPTHAVLPYDHCLALLPAFLQQLEMESNGKSVALDGKPVEHDTAPVIWGMLGNNAQHAFYQMLHQGRDRVPVDFIVPVFSQRALPGHEDIVLSNALGQAEAMMRGQSLQQAKAQVLASYSSPETADAEEVERAARHRVMPGDRPSTTILFEQLNPYTLGALIALYEHKVFVQAVCWNVNPFDQFGVELGKTLAMSLLPAIQATAETHDSLAGHDASTSQLLAKVRTIRQNRGD